LEVETLASPAVQSDREKNQFAHKSAKFVGKLYDKKKGKVKTLFS
jgi:phosphoketolase